jgi:YGGT family protein
MKGKVKMTNERMTEVKSVQQEPEREQRVFSFKITQLIWLALGILEALIALRIGLKLIGANPDSPIVSLIYGFTYLFLFPFEGMTATPAAGGMVLELSSLFAMLIYALIAWAVERIIWLLLYRPRGPVVGTTQTTSSERHINP